MVRTTRHATLPRISSFANGEVCARESSINLSSQVSTLLKPLNYFLEGAQASPSEFLREALGVYGKFDRYVSDERLLEMLSGRSEAIIASTFKQAQPDEQNLVLNKP